jgi:cytoskeleton protein RodZ
MITRGFIRNYARLLGIDAEPLLQAYREHVPSANLYPISIPSANIPILNHGKRSWRAYFVASLVIAVVLGLWVVYMDYLPKRFGKQTLLSTMGPAVQQSSDRSVPLPASLPPVVPTPEIANSTPSIPGDAGAAGKTPQAVEQNIIAGAADSQVVTTPTIKLSFSGKSWVSVTDASNKKILDTIKVAGSEEVLHGEPPFRITIGNAAVSQLIYNDKPVDLAPYTKLNVARVTLE